jgi:hypothetical protein
MAGTTSEDSGVGRSVEGNLSAHRHQSCEELSECRSSEQVENGTPSTSLWDIEDDDDCGPKPSELYGKYTWKIEKFRQINKRELRSNSFEVGGYKWYILIYPQGCDVCNHLSLFLCVANHDKLLPGWSHFAQFTIAVTNKDQKKSKYSDTLHRFWKKEHDWGWKKFMELTKVEDGFINDDKLIIKAQVQVIRERADRPFRCLDSEYRKELVRVYLTNVEQACRRFVEESRTKLGKLIEDKSRWTSFCSFWVGIDQNVRRRMSREKTDSILKAVVKRFFIEKEVTSTLVMDSLYSGLKALECSGQIIYTNNKSKKIAAAKGKYSDGAALEEIPIPIVRLEKDTFVLVDDVLLLLERAAMEPLPPKDDKGPQNRTKDGGSGEDPNKESNELDERRLTELGRRTIEIFVLAHIFSKIEVAYQEAVALKRQEELIREEEAAWLAEGDHKQKRASVDKEKKSKKKQAKQKRNNRKGKEKIKDEKSTVAMSYKADQETQSQVIKDALTEATQGKAEILEDASDLSDSLECVRKEPKIIYVEDPNIIYIDLIGDSSSRLVNSDTDTSEVLQASTESSGSGAHSSVQNKEKRKSPSVVDDSSSTCSTDSLPSVVMNGPYKGTTLPTQKSPARGKNQRGRAASDVPALATEVISDARKVAGTESEAAVVNDLQDRIKRLEQHVFKKEEEVVSLQRKLSDKDEGVDLDRPKIQTTAEVPRSTTTSPPLKPESNPVEPTTPITVPAKIPSPETTQPSDKPVNSAEPAVTSKVPHTSNNKPASPTPTEKASPPQPLPEKPTMQKLAPSPPEKSVVMSRPLSAPLIPGSKPTVATTVAAAAAITTVVPVVSIVQTAPLLSRSVSAASRLGPESSSASHSFVPQSYRNAMMGNHIPATSAAYTPPPPPPPHSPRSPVTSSSVTYSQPPVMMSSPMFLPQGTESSPIRPNLSFGMLNPSLMNDFQGMDLYNKQPPVQRFQSEFPASISGRQYQHGGVSTDEFPHLDIINDLLDDENSVGSYQGPDGYRSFGNGPHHLHRQFTFPGDVGMTAEAGPSSSSAFERHNSFDKFHHGYGSAGGGQGQFDMTRDMVRQTNSMPYTNGHMDGSGMVPNEWHSDLSYLGLRNSESDAYLYRHLPEYPSVNGYPVFRPSNGH